MKSMIVLAACALVLPAAAQAATRTYDIGSFDSIEVAAGITVDVTLGPGRSVVAETGGDDFEDLQVRAEGNVLKIGRPARSWFRFGWLSSGRRADYRVSVRTPALRSLSAGSGSTVTVKGGSSSADMSIQAGSGSKIDLQLPGGGAVAARGSSGSSIYLSGSCRSVRIQASSGSNLDAEDLHCETADVHASSGSQVSVTATRSVAGAASSGSRVKVRGSPGVVDVKKSSGAEVRLRN